MNLKFQKALFMLDNGQFEKAEILLKQALEETENGFERIQITACYAEFLEDMERFDEAYEKAFYILENTDEYDNDSERKTAENIIERIDLRKENGNNGFV